MEDLQAQEVLVLSKTEYNENFRIHAGVSELMNRLFTTNILLLEVVALGNIRNFILHKLNLKIYNQFERADLKQEIKSERKSSDVNVVVAAQIMVRNPYCRDVNWIGLLLCSGRLWSQI